MDPKFVEKGLTPIDLMTVKKKLEVKTKNLIIRLILGASHNDFHLLLIDESKDFIE